MFVEAYKHGIKLCTRNLFHVDPAGNRTPSYPRFTPLPIGTNNVNSRALPMPNWINNNVEMFK